MLNEGSHMPTNWNQVAASIISEKMTATDIAIIIDAIRFAQSRLSKVTKASLSIGDTVQWTSRKNPKGEKGIVQKIATKFVTVQTANGIWRVPANMLTAV